MGMSHFESTDAAQAINPSGDSASFRMLEDIKVSVGERHNSATKCLVGPNGESEEAQTKCRTLSEKEISKMLNDFSVDQGQLPNKFSDSAQAGAASGRSGDCHSNSSHGQADKHPGKMVGKPWNPENGVCAPGSPFKINCNDDKEQKLFKQ